MPVPDDQLVIDYLLGALPDEDAVRLDELSITDDHFAARLSEVENDLVDAYVGESLSGDTLDRFKAKYLSSPTGLEKVRFAEGLLRYQTTQWASTPAARNRRLFAPRLVAGQWGLAAAALLVLTTSAYLLVENVRLRQDLNVSQAERATLQERERQLQGQLDARRAAEAQAAEAQARARAPLAQPNRTPLIASFLLLPATRGPGDLTTITFAHDTDSVTLALSDLGEFPAYEATLRDLVGNRIIWRGTRLRATMEDGVKKLSITVAANLLKSGTYSVDVSGVPATGAVEPVNSFPFRVAIQ